MLEKDIQSRCVRFARKNGWWARKFSSPSQRSVPDYIFGKGGRVFFVEFKATGKVPTDKQWLEILALEMADVEVHVVDYFDTRWAALLGEEPAPRMPCAP